MFRQVIKCTFLPSYWVVFVLKAKRYFSIFSSFTSHPTVKQKVPMARLKQCVYAKAWHVTLKWNECCKTARIIPEKEKVLQCSNTVLLSFPSICSSPISPFSICHNFVFEMSLLGPFYASPFTSHAFVFVFLGNCLIHVSSFPPPSSPLSTIYLAILLFCFSLTFNSSYTRSHLYSPLQHKAFFFFFFTPLLSYSLLSSPILSSPLLFSPLLMG